MNPAFNTPRTGGRFLSSRTESSSTLAWPRGQLGPRAAARARRGHVCKGPGSGPAEPLVLHSQRKRKRAAPPGEAGKENNTPGRLSVQLRGHGRLPSKDTGQYDLARMVPALGSGIMGRQGVWVRSPVGHVPRCGFIPSRGTCISSAADRGSQQLGPQILSLLSHGVKSMFRR